MKKIFILSIALLSFTIFSSCSKCIQCDIYDGNGDYVKDYGEYCGEDYMMDEYQEEADYHAWRFYGGWAECYYN